MWLWKVLKYLEKKLSGRVLLEVPSFQGHLQNSGYGAIFFTETSAISVSFTSGHSFSDVSTVTKVAMCTLWLLYLLTCIHYLPCVRWQWSSCGWLKTASFCSLWSHWWLIDLVNLTIVVIDNLNVKLGSCYCITLCNDTVLFDLGNSLPGCYGDQGSCECCSWTCYIVPKAYLIKVQASNVTNSSWLMVCWHSGVHQWDHKQEHIRTGG